MRPALNHAALSFRQSNEALGVTTAAVAKNGTARPNAIWPDDLNREVYGVLGIPLDVTDMATVLQRIKSADENLRPFLISTTNLNYLIISRHDSKFRESLLLSDLCIADGMPIVWIPRLLGIPIKERIAGSDIFEALKHPHEASVGPVKVFLFGAEEGVASTACQNLNADPENMTCVGSFYPGFGTVDDMSADSIIKMVNDSGADFLVVALGAAKGQNWLQRNHDRLMPPIRVHLGATLKYEAKIIKRAPMFMRRWGLEWLWRIREEPYLWRRYVADGIRLMGLLVTHVLPLIVLTRWQEIKAKDKAGDLKIFSREDDEALTLRLDGAATARHVFKAVPYFQDALNSDKRIVVDLTNTVIIDARFIGLLLMVNKQVTRRQLRLTLTGGQRYIERFICLNGFGFLLNPAAGI